jgi:pimeloyl-ACP methyl ester carboxylesterase
MVHGGVCDHLAWYFVVPLLARNFAVYTFDRRGRGGSRDSQPATVDREVDDIAALLQHIGEPAHLLGHSAGGILALKAAMRADNLLSLMLYEPAFVVEGARERPAPAVLEKMRALLAANNRAEVVRIAMRESIGLSESEIAAMEAGHGWDHLCGLAHAIPNDWLLWEEHLDVEALKTVQTRTLLLEGSESPSWLRQAAQTIADALPNARQVGLAGQAHSAMITAPELFAQAVTNFALHSN